MSVVSEIESLMGEYRDWLRSKTAIRGIGDEWVEITTPYLDRHNDALQLYVRRENGGFVLTDDGYTIGDLEASGCSLRGKKRQELMSTTLRGFGVAVEDDALEVRATQENFPYRKHSLIQAMLSVNDLFYLAKPVVESLFLEDVTAWLDEIEARYTPKVKFTGLSGYDHLFDFVIPKSRLNPERVVQAINWPVRNTAEAFIHAWTDTREVRPENSRAFAILNDSEASITPEVLDAFKNYQISPVTWSARRDVAEALAA